MKESGEENIDLRGPELVLHNHLHGEPVNTDEARYIDPLSAEQEELWHSLVDAVRQSEVPTYKAMGQIWDSDQFSRPIRDRAMLVRLGGWKVKNVLDIHLLLLYINHHMVVVVLRITKQY